MKKTRHQANIPSLDICTLSEYRQENIMVSRLAAYLETHQNLVFPHRHNFYHLVFFTEGQGSHTIDFDYFVVKPFQVYFMIPGQVHTWDFEGHVDGFVVNFTDSFFQSFLLRPNYIDSLSFFRGETAQSVIDLTDSVADVVLNLFENIIAQANTNNQFHADLVRLLLLQIFITIEQTVDMMKDGSKHLSSNAVIRNFVAFVNKNFIAIKSPGEYAKLLHVTPNHLNALTKEHLGKQAGEVIRDRIILEAKRLLVSLDLTISEIAFKLNFNDNSYFVRFFKKTVGMTTDEFRKRSFAEHK